MRLKANLILQIIGSHEYEMHLHQMQYTLKKRRKNAWHCMSRFEYKHFFIGHKKLENISKRTANWANHCRCIFIVIQLNLNYDADEIAQNDCIRLQCIQIAHIEHIGFQIIVAFHCRRKIIYSHIQFMFGHCCNYKILESIVLFRTHR